MHVYKPSQTSATSSLAAKRGEALLGLAHVLWRRDARAAGLVEAHASDAGLEERLIGLVTALRRDADDRAWEGVTLLVLPSLLAASARAGGVKSVCANSLHFWTNEQRHMLLR